MSNQSLDFGSALLVTLIGMAVVFIGMVVLIFLIKGLVALTGGMGKKKAVPVKTVTLAPAPVPPAPEEPEQDDLQLIAVITAAIACAMGTDAGGFTVKHVRRISSANAWQRAGREEQVYSRF